MRMVVAVSLLALLCPVAAVAQTPPTPAQAATAAPAPAPTLHKGDITRDQYIEHAKAAAEKRFDRMDANHDGVLTLEERRTWRVAHERHHKPPTPQ